MGGLEPPTVSLPQELQTWLLYQLSYTAYHIWFIKFEAHAGAKPCLRYLVIR